MLISDNFQKLVKRSVRQDSGVDTSVLFALSAWLIVNSHLEKFWFHPALAADGMLANSLFYLLSGFGIQRSLLAKEQRFPPYFMQRLLRLYPSVILALGFFLAIGVIKVDFGDIRDFFSFFVWPSPYTYIKMIVPFYALLWLLDRFGIKALYAALLVAFLVFGWTYVDNYRTLKDEAHLALGKLPSLQWWSYFWIVTGVGAILARLKLKVFLSLSRVSVLVLLTVFYFGLKFFMVVGDGIAILYPALHITVLLICIGCVVTLCDPKFVTNTLSIPIIGAFLAFSANVSLQIYVFHEPLTSQPSLYKIAWPLNIGLLCIITILGGAVLYLITERIRLFIEKSTKPL